MITTSTWVPRGFAAPFPSKYTFDESEYERIAELAKLQLDDAEEDLKEAQDAEDGVAASATNGTEESKTEKLVLPRLCEGASGGYRGKRVILTFSPQG